VLFSVTLLPLLSLGRFQLRLLLQKGVIMRFIFLKTDHKKKSLDRNTYNLTAG